jgi:hypothetical protein
MQAAFYDGEWDYSLIIGQTLHPFYLLREGESVFERMFEFLNQLIQFLIHLLCVFFGPDIIQPGNQLSQPGLKLQISHTYFKITHFPTSFRTELLFYLSSF